MLPVLLHVYYHLNHVDVQVDEVNNHKEDDFFSKTISNDDVIFFIMKNEL
jgi:hypothetical protein